MSLSRFFRISRLSNVHVALSECRKNATVQLPGLSADDFNRAGSIGVWRILHWCTWSRIAAFHTPDDQTDGGFLEYDKCTSGMFTFIASTKTTVNKAFYQMLDAESPPKLSVDLHLGYVGMSSLNTVAVLSSGADSESVLARNVNQVVCIDRGTRKPTPIPEWWKHKYESFVIENERLVLPALEVPSENVYKYDVKVSWSEIDAYRHVNYLSYVKFCFDAATDAVANKFYAGFSDDILKYNVKSIENAYKGECVAGDLLTVVTWQHRQNPHMLQFSIDKNGTVIFESSVEFFE